MVMREAAERVASQNARIALLEAALARMITMVDDSRADSEGRYPTLDSGCVMCTEGVTPDQFNTGLCAYHSDQHILRQP